MEEVKRGGWKKAIDLVGWPPFGRLTVIERAGKGSGNKAMWLCRCDCGNECVVSGSALRRGATRSCGCIRSEQLAQRLTKHGHAKNGVFTPEYRAWTKLKERCLNENNKNYDRYGGRGIKVCDRWLDSQHGFENFLADVGPRPSDSHTIDRYPNNDGNYEPGNVRWADRTE